jgi:DNA-binding Lrp family transcriptional regulator
LNPDPLDSSVLRLLQDEFPLVPDPWKALGKELGLSGSEVLQRVRSLRSSGILKGVCPILESGKAGIGASTLVALKVPAMKVEEIALIINTFPQVSHNYQRDNRYNLWFTLGAADRLELESLLLTIRKRCGLKGSDMIELPVKRRFKIDVRFPVDTPGEAVHEP